MTVKLKPVEKQVAVITGATSGIGLATARMFSRRGARGLVLAARNGEALNDIAAELNGAGTRTISVAADTSRAEDIASIARAAIDAFGGFDTWVNDAAVAIYGRLEDIPLEDQRRLFDVNYWGVVYGSLEAARHLRERGGALINVGSVLSERTMILQTQYSASKHAVKGFTDGLRMELERDGAPVSVTLIKPSSIDTPYVEHARNYLDKEPKVPSPVYDPDLVAQAILFASVHRRREMTVGFGGWTIAALGAVAPRLTDKIMERTGYGTQTTDETGRQAMRDNLYAPRKDGDAYSSHQGRPRQHSLFLATQMHPLLALLGVTAIGALASLVLRRSTRQAPPPRSYRVVTHRRGNGHDKKVFGPGHPSERGSASSRQAVHH